MSGIRGGWRKLGGKLLEGRKILTRDLWRGQGEWRSFSASAVAAARFKMKVERPVTEEKKEGEEMEGREETGGYLKNHPYRAFTSVWKSKSELAQHLIDNLIHNDHGLFITNKPWGVGVLNPPPLIIQRRTEAPTGAHLHVRGIPSCPYTLEDLLPELRYRLDKPSLVVAKSTEKYSSGIAVFAEDAATADLFSKRLASSKMHYDILYKVHVVTTLPPALVKDYSLPERVGIGYKKLVGSELNTPVILPEYSRNSVKRRDVIAAHCLPKLLQSGVGGAYLLELNTSTVSRFFLRIYCADKLAPVLGDHLFSSRVQTLKGIPAKIDPSHLTPGQGYQYLPKTLQETLKLRKPEDSLMIPTHIHLRAYKVRNFLPGMKGAVIEMEAPYPPFFRWTCEQAGIVLGADAIVDQDQGN